MRTSILCTFVILFVVGSALDYTQANLGDGSCTNAPTGSLESPIIIENSICGAHGNFNLDMANVNNVAPFFNATTGAFQIAYTGGSLTYNSTTYTSTAILFRYKSENILFGTGNQADGELQILMQDSTGAQAVFSLFLRQTAGNQAYIFAQSTNNIITSITVQDWTFLLATLANNINNKASEDLFLNVFRYEGTQTFPPCGAAVWYLYGQEIFVDDLSALITALGTQSAQNGVTLRQDSQHLGENSKTVSSATPIVIERLCFSGFFENHMGDNYGLWFGIIIILIFFFITLCIGDNPINNPDYQESCKTIHPIYSICVVSNDIHTRKSRAALILMTVTTHALFSSTWYRRSYPNVKGSDIIVYAIYSMLISWGYIYILGNILRGYYVAKYHYCKTRDESWDQKAQNRIFAFYVAVFATICIAWPFTVWNMGEIHPERNNKQSNYWVATFFVGLGLEFLVCDVICAMLAKPSHLMRNFIRRKGYMYDNLCHETYLNYIKMD